MEPKAFLKALKEPDNANIEYIAQEISSAAPTLTFVLHPQSIVAVHGLNPFNRPNHAEATWTAEHSGNLWLRDFLPNQIPRARIFLFGYNANPAFSSGSEGVYEQANNLLVKLFVERGSDSDRPLIFICHSLGGLVVKRAMVQAQQSQTYQQIARSVYGLVFFATPHQGGNNAVLGDVAASIARFVLRNPANSYLEAVKKNGFFAEALSYDFRNFQDHFSMLSFYETRQTSAGIIVSRKSAVLGLGDDREMVLGLEADHSGICKFEDQNGSDYRPVGVLIKGLVEKAVKRAEEEKRLSALAVPSDDASGQGTAAPLREIQDEFALVVTGDLFASYLDIGIVQKPNRKGPMAHFTHTSAYARWVHEGHGILWYTTDDQVYPSAILSAAETLRDDIPGLYILYYECKKEDTTTMEAGKRVVIQKQSLPIKVPLALIVRHIRLGCMRGDSCDPGIVRERIQDMVTQGIDLERIWAGLRSPTKPIQGPMDQLAKLLKLPFVGGTQPLVVIDNLDALESDHMAPFLSGLNDIAKSARILLSGTIAPLVRRALGTLAHIDKDTEYQECLRSLNFREIFRRRDHVQDAEDGTNNWIFGLEQYRQWQSQNSGILWIQGKPGSGKSVLAKSLVRRMAQDHTLRQPNQEDQMVVGWFYSRRDGAATMDHTSMLRSILYQVLQESPKSFDTVASIYRQKSPFDMDESFSWNLRELKTMLANISASRLRMVCILDGLDESEDGERSGMERGTFLKEILKLSRDPNSQLKFIALSRRSNDITKAFVQESNFQWSNVAAAGSKQPSGVYQIIMQDENSRDIETIVDHGLQTLQQTFSPVEETNNGGALHSILSQMQYNEASGFEDMRKHILENAEGVILWVTLVIGTLKTYCKHGGVSITKLKQKLERLPPKLKDLYQYIVEDLQKLPSDIQEKSRVILMWVSEASSVRALTLEELWDAMAIPEKVEQALLDEKDYRLQTGILIQNLDDFSEILSEWCGPFLDVIHDRGRRQSHTQSQTTAVVQLLHQTVKEFLHDEKASRFLHFTDETSRSFLLSSGFRYTFIQQQRFAKYHSRVHQGAFSARAKDVVSFLRDKCLLLYFLKTRASLYRDNLDPLSAEIFDTASQEADARLDSTSSDESLDTTFEPELPGKHYLQVLFQEACSSGDTSAVECLLHLPGGEWWHIHKWIVLVAVLDAAVKAGLHKWVGLLLGGSREKIKRNYYSSMALRRYAQTAFNKRDWDMYLGITSPSEDVSLALGTPKALQKLKGEFAFDFALPGGEQLRNYVLQRRAGSKTENEKPTSKSSSSATPVKNIEAVEECVKIVIDYWRDQDFKSFGGKI